MNQLSIQQQALLELVKMGIGTSNSDFDFTTLTADDWAEVMKASRVQTVHLLCYDAAKNLTALMPKEINEQWFLLSAKTIAKNHMVLNAQNELIKLLDKNDFSYIILKGFAAASYYPDFEKRCYGDVDFLISPSQQQAVEDVLISEGYIRELNDHICHRVFKKPGAHLEMHFEVAGIPNGSQGQVFRKYFENASRKHTLNDNPVFCNPNPETHAIILLLHTIHHMVDEGLGLRHLCDWACFVNKTYKEAFWASDVLPILEKTGTLNFAVAVTKTCAVYLGTVCPNWAENVDEKLCFQIITDILDLGNFGRGNLTRSVSGRMITQHGKNGIENRKSAYFANKINDIVQDVSANANSKISVPFIVTWRLIKTFFLMLSGKRISAFKTNAYANERKSIYEQFRLFETDNK